MCKLALSSKETDATRLVVDAVSNRCWKAEKGAYLSIYGH